MLDRWAATLNRWLQVLAIVLTWTAVFLAALTLVATVLGFIGFRQFMDIRDEAKHALTKAEVAERKADAAHDSTRRLWSEHAALEQQVQRSIVGKVDPPDEEKDDQLTDLAALPVTELDIPDLFSALLSARGFVPFREELEGALTSGATRRESFALPTGFYSFTGACDVNCADLDLILYGEGNEEDPLAEDLLLDAFPIVTFDTDTPENVVLEVVMVECSAEPCTWNLKAYRSD